MMSFVYIGVCFVVPLAWGMAIAVIFARIDRRKRLRTHVDPPPPNDYSI